jgi:hypothetical protein
MALLDRDHRDAAKAVDGVDRRLLVVAVALAVLTLLAILDLDRPVPGSLPPVEVRIPPVDLPLAPPPVMSRRPLVEDDLLIHD